MPPALESINTAFALLYTTRKKPHSAKVFARKKSIDMTKTVRKTIIRKRRIIGTKRLMIRPVSSFR